MHATCCSLHGLLPPNSLPKSGKQENDARIHTHTPPRSSRRPQVHAAGQLLMRDFVSMLPFTDDLVLLELSGGDLLRVLETGVGAVPALEGRFLQASAGL